MANLYFDEANHPQMLSVALKGEPLKEFITLSREALKLTQSLAPRDSTPQDKAVLQFLIKLQKTVIDGITEKIDNHGALQFGIDLNDLRTMISSAAKLDVKNIDYNAVRQEFLESMVEVDPASTEINEEAKKFLTQDCAKELMRNFSACLALQERKENEYVKMVTQAQKENIAYNVIHILGTLPKEQNDDKMFCSIQVMGDVVTALLLSDLHKKRSSPISKMEQEILVGKGADKSGGLIGETRKVLARINGYDINKHADRKMLHDIEKDILELTAQLMGATLPSSLRLS